MAVLIFYKNNINNRKEKEMVKSEEIYSPQAYLEKMTGLYYFIPIDKPVVEFIEEILDKIFGEGSFWSHTLSDIEEIVENDLDVVLVDCMDSVYNPESEKIELKPCYRWFEVNENFERNE